MTADNVADLPAPALVVDVAALDRNIEVMRAALPGARLRPISAGGTGIYACNSWATEIQAGSYALMDAQYGRQEHPFSQAVFVLANEVVDCWPIDLRGWSPAAPEPAA